MKKDQKTDRPSFMFRFWRLFFSIFFFPCLKNITGFENLPEDGAFIIAANHSSRIDGLLLTVYLSKPHDRNIRYLVAAKYYANPFYRNLFESAKDIKLDAKQESKSTYAALNCLKKGEIIGIFPEGLASRNGKINKGLPGVAYLALSAKVPVVPVGVIGSGKYLPWGKAFPRYARMEIHIGKPLGFEQYYREYDEATGKEDRGKIREIEERVVRIIMQECARLSNQEYLY